MSVKVQRFIAGDTPIDGFRKIGSSPEFRDDSVRMLTNGAALEMKARIQSSSGRATTGEVRVLSHVWEYQVGNFGMPVIANTTVATGIGRPHGFTEYAVLDTNNAAAMASVGQIISAARHTENGWLQPERFMNLAAKEEIPLSEESWNVAQETNLSRLNVAPSAAWLQALLFHYWKQASVRAFTEDTPSVVHVRIPVPQGDDNLTSRQEDMEYTIDAGARFFAEFVAEKLPPQVQNIASMVAGRDAADRGSLYNALEFNILANMPADATLILGSDDLRGYRLNEAEQDFMERVMQDGRLPAVERFFEAYKKLTDRPTLDVLTVPFMADHALWYELYLMDRVAAEGEDFIKAAGLNRETTDRGTMILNTARSCYQLMRRFRATLRRHPEFDAKMVESLVEDAESKLYDLMEKDLQSESAKPFIMRRNEMVELHTRILAYAPEKQLPQLIRLICLDQRRSAMPQFVAVYPAVPIKNAEADRRNAMELAALLRETIRPRIENEVARKGTKIEDPCLLALIDENFQAWSRATETREALKTFLREEIANEEKHFLLYRITRTYLEPEELACRTFRLWAENHSSVDSMPTDLMRHVAQDNWKTCIQETKRPACVSAMNEYYVACFNHFGSNLGQISEIVKSMDTDSGEAMQKIFTDALQAEEPMNQEEAAALFGTLGGQNNKYAAGEAVKTAYNDMLSFWRDKMLQQGESPVKWLRDMMDAAPFDVDSVGHMAAIFRNAATGVRKNVTYVNEVFEKMQGPDGRYAKEEEVREAFAEMLAGQRDAMLSADEKPISWMSNMLKASADFFDVDNTESLVAIFRHAADGERMSKTDAAQTFEVLNGRKNVAGSDEVKQAFVAMLSAQRDKMLAENESPVSWLCDMIEAADSYMKVDTSDSLVKIFKAAEEGPRMEIYSAETAFGRMGNKADSLQDKVKAAYMHMTEARLDEALNGETKDDTIIDWIAGMMNAAKGSFEFDTTNSLVKIFNRAKQGERISPDDARNAFRLADKADGLGHSVKRVYNEMLNQRREEIKAPDYKYDSSDFSWLCEMTKGNQFDGVDSDWHTEQNSLNAMLLCDLSERDEKPVSGDDLRIVSGWLKRGLLSDRAVGRLQKLSNHWLQKGGETPDELTAAHEPAEVLYDGFRFISSDCTKLREYGFDMLSKRLEQELNQGRHGSFSELLAPYTEELKKIDRDPFMLYADAQVKAAADRWMEERFQNVNNLERLTAEESRIPAGFRDKWSELLNLKYTDQQIETFNGSANLADLMSLRSTLEKRGKLNPALKAAYEVIENYDGMLERLQVASEYEVVLNTAEYADKLAREMKAAEPVRTTLVRCLRKEVHPMEKELRRSSFRHALAGLILQNMLIERDPGENVHINWPEVIRPMFNEEETSAAVRKPYAPQNLRILQRMLALMETVRDMDTPNTTGQRNWLAQVQAAMGANGTLHSYSQALSRDRKMQARYQLSFDGKGDLQLAAKQTAQPAYGGDGDANWN